MSNMLQDYFQHRLVSLGYPEDFTVEYSLGYCQGDGVAFYGRIDDDSAEKLMKRLLSPNRIEGSAVERVRNLMAYKHIDNLLLVIREYTSVALEIARNSHGNRYSHYNSMDLNDESESIVDVFADDEDDELEKITGIAGLNRAMLAEWGELWVRFYQALKEDIVDTSKTLEQEGYKLLEAMAYEEVVVWAFTTENYIVRLSEMPSRDFDMDGWDEDTKLATLTSMLDGEERVVGLKAEVLDRETETVLGEDSLYGIVYATDDKSYGGYRSELVRYAVKDAKGFINRLATKAA
ncbi:NgrC [Marinobacterium aestuariivivens]|uniref:NgrC n=1 Tax=Marinobacterium aestuariivivens TaxID=1698799 RepID=A0ABW2A8Y3_9GAMM